jgi:hypothetical protein
MPQGAQGQAQPQDAPGGFAPNDGVSPLHRQQLSHATPANALQLVAPVRGFVAVRTPHALLEK